MKVFVILLAAAAGIGLLALLLALVCFLIAFYAPRWLVRRTEKMATPPGKIYEPYRDAMTAWTKETREMPHEDVTIRSFDGLALCGRYYECRPGAPIELMVHGYRGNADRDLCGGVQRSFALGHNALIVDQRTSGRSEGRVISFGVNESRDCLAWVDFMVEQFGPEVKIILTGISMGAATVLIAAGMELPPNVVGVLADCGYTSARDIICKVIRQLGLPARLLFPFVKLGAKLFGRFDLEEVSPMEGMKKCRVPVVFIHGEADDFVPCDMSRANYEACAAPKRLLTVPGAGHGLSYLVDREGYLAALAEMWSPLGL